MVPGSECWRSDRATVLEIHKSENETPRMDLAASALSARPRPARALPCAVPGRGGGMRRGVAGAKCCSLNCHVVSCATNRSGTIFTRECVKSTQPQSPDCPSWSFTSHSINSLDSIMSSNLPQLVKNEKPTVGF